MFHCHDDNYHLNSISLLFTLLYFPLSAAALILPWQIYRSFHVQCKSSEVKYESIEQRFSFFLKKKKTHTYQKKKIVKKEKEGIDFIFLDSEFIDSKSTWLRKKENLTHSLYFFTINLSIFEGIWWIGRIWRKKPWNLYSMPAYDYYSEAEVTLIEASFISLAYSQKPVTTWTVHFKARNCRIPVFLKRNNYAIW